MINFKSIVAVGAHPDDVEFSCLGFLLKEHKAGASIVVYVASNGSLGDSTSGKTRLEETKEALKCIPNAELIMVDSPGVCLEDYETMAVELRNLFLRTKPDLILVHDKNDTHQEHRLLRDIVITASRRLRCSIFTYKSVSVTSGYNENIFVDISEFIEPKINSISKHKSQQIHAYMSNEFIDNYHKNWFGLMHGMTYTETFHVEQYII